MAAETTKICIPRLRSYSQTNNDPAHILSSNSITLPYGSPLTCASELYVSETNAGKNHFFCMGDAMLQNGNFSPTMYHVGPYWGDAGITVENDPTSGKLGQIALNIVAGTGISITNASNNRLQISATGTAVPEDVLVCTAVYNSNTGYYTMTGLTRQQIVDAYTAGKVVLCKLSITNGYYNFQYCYLSLAADPGTIEFASIRNDSHYLVWLSARGTTDSDEWELHSEDLNDIVESDIYEHHNFTDGTTAFPIEPTYRRKYIILDNSSNSSDVTVSLNMSNISQQYALYTNFNGSNFTLEHGKSAIVKAKYFPYTTGGASSYSVYLEASELVKTNINII